jgi:transposase
LPDTHELGIINHVEDMIMVSTGKRYNNEFRADVIRLVKVEGRAVSSVAKDLGVNDQTIRNWLKDETTQQDPTNVEIAELKAELKDARKKIADHEVTIDILKKATAIFAQNNRR